MGRALVVHGHFYQPPRENPWTGVVDEEPSAAPFHDWNERIHRECYRAAAMVSLPEPSGSTARIFNAYTRMSFDFGPSLLSWLEREHPATYHLVVEADRTSSRKRGHGNAIAHPSTHAILPLANERDRRTLVRWGLADFRARFGRSAEAMWLPETACDRGTADVLVEEGMRFALLASRQAARTRPLAGGDWTAAADLDTTRPYRYVHSAGRGSLDVFFFDATLADALCVNPDTARAGTIAKRAAAAARDADAVAHVVSDGEVWGHHVKDATRELAALLQVEAPAAGLETRNYGELCELRTPTHEVELAHGADGLGTSWSCEHGVARWMRHCGCGAISDAPSQEWRAPLRRAIDLVRDAAAEALEGAGRELFDDPWAARDRWGEALVAGGRTPAEVVGDHARSGLRDAERRRAGALLALHEHALTMYTSCGWFFSDISGLEAVLVMRQAARTLDALDALGLRAPRAELLEALGDARSNHPERGTGADVYQRVALAARPKAP